MTATFAATDSGPGCVACAAAATRDTVVVVEDDPVVGALIPLLLAPLGMRRVRVSDASACLQWFTENPGSAALVVMDCGLPDARDGALASQLRNLAPNLPLLLTSGQKAPEVFGPVAAEGPADFISKPFGPNELLQRARALLAPTAAW